MSKFKDILIDAEDALRAVGEQIANIPEGALDGSVEELTYSTADKCFCVVYVAVNAGVTTTFDDFIRVLFVWTAESGAVRVETSEFCLIPKDIDLSGEIPTLMERINVTSEIERSPYDQDFDTYVVVID
jgi:hypothetical protein